MSFRSAEALGRLIVRLRLVEPGQLDECLTRLGPTQRKPEDLLRLLENRHYLTTYQVGALQKGETDALVLGGYKLLYRNASGSFARVFRAESIEDGRMVALKLLRQRWAKDKSMIEQFRREALLCKRLQHKNIVPIYEVGSENGQHFFTMEFVEGGNLRDFINIRKKLSPLEAARCALDMAEGLEYALKRGITHRDLKLTNVLMSTQGVAKLVDFGLAGDLAISGQLDSDGEQRALEYATLEKGTGAPDGDPRSDLFFLGAIYYELLTGIPPWPRTRDREERKRLTRYTQVQPLESLDPQIPQSVVEVVEKLMRTNPAGRYQSPRELIGELRRTLAELGNGGGGINVASSRRDDAADGAGREGGRGHRPKGGPLKTVMCVESRRKQQDILREYLSKRGFRVLVLSDVERAMARLRESPPDCIVLMGESIGSEIVQVYQRTSLLEPLNSFVVIAVLSNRQAELKPQFEQTHTARVLVQPVTLRDLRREIHLAFQRQIANSRELSTLTADELKKPKKARDRKAARRKR